MGRYLNTDYDLSALQLALEEMTKMQAGTALLNLAPGQLLPFGQGFIRLFASSGSFTVPAGVTRMRFRVWGPGGKGGFSNSNSWGASGAGGGGYAHGEFSVTPGQVIPITVGKISGETSSVGPFISATSGQDGAMQTAVGVTKDGGLGGTGVGGDYQAKGGKGGKACGQSNGCGGGGAPGSPLGDGGDGGDGYGISGGGGGAVGGMRGGDSSAGTTGTTGGGGASPFAPGESGSSAFAGEGGIAISGAKAIGSSSAGADGSSNPLQQKLRFPLDAFVGGGGAAPKAPSAPTKGGTVVWEQGEPEDRLGAKAAKVAPVAVVAEQEEIMGETVAWALGVADAPNPAAVRPMPAAMVQASSFSNGRRLLCKNSHELLTMLRLKFGRHISRGSRLTTHSTPRWRVNFRLSLRT